ncbi:MAG: ribose-5-phosphate isomerase RpiA [Gammaproteobacteria bacterium]|nr:ribose-5-phosphate isomerase RpiA [Gammaproteobacteria bacterium]MCP4473564.1 ribose-5-phosphate isomerase RpiA [Gammaproteobacteria bacterium]
MAREQLKKQAAEAALEYIEYDTVVGVGTGSTVNYFIDALAKIKGRIDGAVSSSNATTAKLQAAGIRVIDLNEVSEISVYVDGADEINAHLQMIKGGGMALTGEKIVASVASRFICIVDVLKRVEILGQGFPVPIEVIPKARSAIGRALVKLGANPVYRQGAVTDYGNWILDVANLPLIDPVAMESQLDSLPGVVCNGIFARRRADILLSAHEGGVDEVTH